MRKLSDDRLVAWNHNLYKTIYFLFLRVSTERQKFSHILHIVYLVNDVGHHCSRKTIPDLQKALGDVVVFIFAIAQNDGSQDNREKVIKVQKIWETNKIFSDEVLEVMFHCITVLRFVDRNQLHSLPDDERRASPET